MPGRLMAWLGSLHGWRADMAGLASGMLTALAFPPIHLFPVLIATIPVLIALIGAARTRGVAARRGWWFGFGLNLVGLYWITEAILIEAARFWWLVPLAVPALAAVLAVFVAVAAGVAHLARPGWRRALALGGAWVLADLARQFIATGFPWNPIGSIWELPGILGDVMIQPAAWVGVHGLTLATLICAALLSLGWRWRCGVAAMMVAWFGVGLVRLDQPAASAPGISVVLVQGNVAQGQKWNRVLVAGIFERYLRLTREGVTEARDAQPAGDTQAVVVWPETASPFWLETDRPARDMIQSASEGYPSLIGAVREGGDGRPRNSLFALVGSGDIAGVYDKWHLVPFGEYQPDWFPLGIQVVPGGGFGQGPGPRTLHIPGVPPVGPLICYEAIFPAQVVDPADRPAWLVNVTNDAWFGNSTGPRQHLAAARMRAVEEGLPLFRAANTGISAAFDAHGRELGRLGMRQTGVLVIPLTGALPPTLFTRGGLAIPGSLALFCIIAGFFPFVKKQL
jgi:apolipoprotein N-acyltransferase